jgi:hypothetical protein
MKVVIASGFTPDGLTRVTLERHAKAFVNKPYNARHVLKVIRQVLDEDGLHA